MITPGRPTQRCISDDLDSDWDDSADRATAASGDLSSVMKPLHRLEHQVIKKVAHEFSVADSLNPELKREGITDLSDPMWFKVKVGRWRGAVYQDEDGQAWLCAAGYRRGKESTDFYQAFMASVKARGPEGFLPTREDRERLAAELAEARFFDWERDIQDSIRTWVFEARADGTVIRTLEDPDGLALARVTITIVVETIDDEDILDFSLEVVCLDYAEYELLQWAETVACLALDPREQVWRPTSVPDGRSYSFMLTDDETSAFFSDMERPAGPPGQAVPGDEAHWTHRGRVTESTINGHAVKALCGRWFVPRQDHADKPRCRQCDTVYGQLDAG